MEAKGLMVGDWVCFDGDKDYSYPVKIDGLTVSKEGVDAGVEGDWYSQWQPIPLTEDILEANGFVYDAINKRWDKDNLPFTGIKSYGTNFPFMVALSGYIIELHFVHELQHALRLCGLTDLVDNFKIK